MLENHANKEFDTLDTPASDIDDFLSLRQVFPRTKQTLPLRGLDAILDQHIHFTQFSVYEKVSLDSGLTEGYHITIRFEERFKSLSRSEV